MAIAIGEPFEVSPDADEAGLEAARRTLEDRLAALEARALALALAPATTSTRR
jgi:hypothetical protein